MKRYMLHFIHTAEKWVTYFMNNQVKDSDSVKYGSLKSDIYEARPTIFAATTAISVYLNQDSIYYHDTKLYDTINRALDVIASAQREDGSFDYPSCNFKSAPDTAFCFERMYAAYCMLVKYDTENMAKELKDKYYALICSALNAICNGGFHTPNHRWAICAALIQGSNLLAGEPAAEKYLNRIKEYLAEGIDGDEDGQYAERSTGNYNAVVNHSMITMYEESRIKEYLGYVERNLRMMLTYFDPDDTIFTQDSTRQDQGKSEYPDQYFYQYLYMTSLEYNPVFDAAAHKLIKDNTERGADAPDCLYFLMLHPEMVNYTFRGYGFLDTYRKYFKDTGVLRVKKQKYGYTLLKDKSTFLFMKVQETPIYVKIGESYCAIRNFIPQTLDVGDGESTMTALAKGWYYLPFKDYNGTSDWWKMDHSSRELLVSSEVTITVKVRELEDGLELNMKAEGLDRLPLRLEICIPGGSVLENEHFYLQTEKGSSMILRDGYINMTHNQNHLQIGPGYGTHEFQGHYSGEEKNDMGYTVYFNEYTPSEKTVTIKVLD